MTTGLDDYLGSLYKTSTGTKASTAAAAPTAPAGFTADQWKKLTDMAKKNTTLADLMKKFQATSPASESWRRELPTDTTQLLRQLSFNTGEMGMPGGYVGAVQMPSYQTGGNLPAINNPDMSKYGQQPGYGEATFYQQSMKGGMTPVAAMSPLGVPEGWNPGAGGYSSLQSQLQDYLKGINSSGSSSGVDASKYPNGYAISRTGKVAPIEALSFFNQIFK